jgi:hypothetical protein
MATNYPYFKFTSSKWLTGDIVFEDLATQGAFVNICAIYWERDGILTIAEIEKRFSRIIDKTELNRILANLTDRFLRITNAETGEFEIQFLDEQLEDIYELSAKNSKNGSKGGRPKKLKDSEQKPNETQINPPLSELNPKKADKIREEEDKIREDKIILYKSFFEKSINDELWQESVMRSCKINNTAHWINEFNDHANATQEHYNTIKDWRRHCVNWIKKEILKENQHDKSNPKDRIDSIREWGERMAAGGGSQ